MTQAYWHTRRRLWSLREGGRVVAHEPRVMLLDVSLVVLPGAVTRVRVRRQREVCAWADGQRVIAGPGGGGFRLLFDPYRWATFVLAEDETPVTGCRVLRLEPNGEAWGWLLA